MQAQHATELRLLQTQLESSEARVLLQAERVHQTQKLVNGLDEQLEHRRDQVMALALEGNDMKVSLCRSKQAQAKAEAESMAHKEQIGILQSLLRQAQVGGYLLYVCCVIMHFVPGASARSACAMYQMP